MADVDFSPRLNGAQVALLLDYTFEDMEAMYPKLRLEEEGAVVTVIGVHPAGQKYTGKHGYPLASTATIADARPEDFHLCVIPGGFCPDYLRRSEAVLSFILRMHVMKRPVAAICHGARAAPCVPADAVPPGSTRCSRPRFPGPWLFCSTRDAEGRPLCSGAQMTAFSAIKDDVINAGAVWRDEPVVVDEAKNIITSRTPAVRAHQSRSRRSHRLTPCRADFPRAIRT